MVRRHGTAPGAARTPAGPGDRGRCGPASPRSERSHAWRGRPGPLSGPMPEPNAGKHKPSGVPGPGLRPCLGSADPGVIVRAWAGQTNPADGEVAAVEMAARIVEGW